MQERIFTDWLWERSGKLWSQEPIQLQHRLDRHPLFDLDRLASLIERYPEDRYTLVRMGKPLPGGLHPERAIYLDRSISCTRLDQQKIPSEAGGQFAQASNLRAFSRS